MRLVGLEKTYVSYKVGNAKILCILTRRVDGSKKGLKFVYKTSEWF